jgi:predicted DNA-binding transcriptional regulator
MILFIFAWIGYTMATTPPPLPLEGTLEIEEVEVDATDRGGDTDN